MNLTISDKTNLMNTELRELTERRLLFALARFDSRITRTQLVLTDVNGPRGGEDKSVRLEVHLRGAPNVVVVDKGESLSICISRVAERAARSVARAIEKTRSRTRTRPYVLNPLTQP